VPHWARLSPEDLCCINRLMNGYNHGLLGNCTKVLPGRSLFIDP
jgi:hypothetical protein